MCRKKYVLTLFIDEYDIDGLTQSFSVECETGDLAEAREKMHKAAYVRARDDLKRPGSVNLRQRNFPEDKHPIFAHVNRNNKVVDQKRVWLWGPYGYDNVYYYYDIIELPEGAEVDERLFDCGYCEYEVKKFFKPFVAFIADRENESYRTYLVNPSGRCYPRVAELYREYDTEEDELLGIARVKYETLIGVLPPHSYIPLESGDWKGIKSKVWRELDFQGETATKSFHIPLYGTEYNPRMLREINKKGVRLNWEYRVKGDPVIYSAAYLRERGKGKKSEVFNATRQEAYAAIRIAAEKTDSIILKEDLCRGEILLRPDRQRGTGETIDFLLQHKPWLFLASDMAVYFFIAPEGRRKTRIEIIHVYANAPESKKALKYQEALIWRVRDVLGRVIGDGPESASPQ